jgi:hypothetical protein
LCVFGQIRIGSIETLHHKLELKVKMREEFVDEEGANNGPLLASAPAENPDRMEIDAESMKLNSSASATQSQVLNIQPLPASLPLNPSPLPSPSLSPLAEAPPLPSPSTPPAKPVVPSTTEISTPPTSIPPHAPQSIPVTDDETTDGGKANEVVIDKKLWERYDVCCCVRF